MPKSFHAAHGFLLLRVFKTAGNSGDGDFQRLKPPGRREKKLDEFLKVPKRVDELSLSLSLARSLSPCAEVTLSVDGMLKSKNNNYLSSEFRFAFILHLFRFGSVVL